MTNSDESSHGETLIGFVTISPTEVPDYFTRRGVFADGHLRREPLYWDSVIDTGRGASTISRTMY